MFDRIQKFRPMSRKANKNKKFYIILVIWFIIISGIAFVATEWNSISKWMNGEQEEVAENVDENLVDEESEIINENYADVLTNESTDVDSLVTENVTLDSVVDSVKSVATADIEDEPQRVTEVLESNTSQGEFIIVVGAFNTQLNADNQIDIIKKDGHKTAFSLPKKGKYIQVAFGRYMTREAAQKDLAKSKKYNAEAYITKQK